MSERGQDRPHGDQAREAPGFRVIGSLLHLRAHAQAFLEAIGFLRRQRVLIMAMAKRDVSSRYAGQLLGTFWAVGHPLFQMAVMVFVFGVVFRQKIGGTYDMPLDYTVYILSGLAAWLSLAPVLASSATSVTSNTNLIKQFTFDARVLPAKEIIIGSIVWAVSVGIVMLYTLAVYHWVPWTYVLIPVLTIIHFMTALGLAWVLAALSVFLRDIKDMVTLANTAMLYLLPVVYLPTWTPELFRPVIYANPFSYLIWVYQDVFYFGRIEHPWAWFVSAAFALFLFTSGYRFFRRLQPMFGSAL
jgi:lipopolysaccharide transport system permease protein